MELLPPELLPPKELLSPGLLPPGTSSRHSEFLKNVSNGQIVVFEGKYRQFRIDLNV